MLATLGVIGIAIGVGTLGFVVTELIMRVVDRKTQSTIEPDLEGVHTDVINTVGLNDRLH
jgi:hypothetical protein